jgi:hypothetical protein
MMLKSLNNLHVVKVALASSFGSPWRKSFIFIARRRRALIDRNGKAQLFAICSLSAATANHQEPSHEFST